MGEDYFPGRGGGEVSGSAGKSERKENLSNWGKFSCFRLTVAGATNEITNKDGVVLKPAPELQNYLHGQKNKKRICIFSGLFARNSFSTRSIFSHVLQAPAARLEARFAR
jgi:hypothetical protein